MNMGYIKHPITRDIILIEQPFVHAYISRKNAGRVQDYVMVPVADARRSVGPVRNSRSFTRLFDRDGMASRYVNNHMARIWNQRVPAAMHRTPNADSDIYVLRPVWA